MKQLFQKKNITILLICFGWSGIAISQTYSLDQCLEIALRNGPAAKIAGGNFVMADLQYRSFKASLLPGLNLSGNIPGFNRSINPVTLPDGTREFVQQNQAFSMVSLSMQQTIPWTGSQFTLISSLNRLDVFGNTGYIQYQSIPLLAGISQPLLRFNELKWQLRSRPIQFSIQEIQYLESLEDLRVDVTGKFFDLFISNLALNNAQFNVASNDSIRKISVNRYNAGKISQNDQLQSELAFLNSEFSLRQATLAKERAERELKLALGISPGETIEIIPPVQAPDFSVDLTTALNHARMNRSDFKNMELRNLTARTDVIRAKMDRLPDINLNASYGLNQSGETISEVYTSPLNQQSASVGFNIPIFQWGKATRDYETALVKEKVTLEQTDWDAQRILQEVEFQVKGFDQLREQVALATRADTIAQKRFEAAKNGYLIGKTDITNLQIAQNEKDQARSNYARTMKSFWTGYYQLRRATLYDWIRGERLMDPVHSRPGGQAQ